MSSVAKAGKAIYAAEVFIPKGSLTQSRFNLLREIAIGTVLGISAGMVWKVSLLLPREARALAFVGQRPASLVCVLEVLMQLSGCLSGCWQGCRGSGDARGQRAI